MPCDRPAQMDDCMAAMVLMFLSSGEQQQQNHQLQRQEVEDHHRHQYNNLNNNNHHHRQDQEQNQHLQQNNHQQQQHQFHRLEEQPPNQQHQELLKSCEKQTNMSSKLLEDASTPSVQSSERDGDLANTAVKGAKRNSEPIEMDTSSQQKLYQRHFKRRLYSGNSRNVVDASGNVRGGTDRVAATDGEAEAAALNSTTANLLLLSTPANKCGGAPGSGEVDTDPEVEACEWRRSRQRPRNDFSISCEMQNELSEKDEDDSNAELRFVENSPPKVEDEMIFELQQVDDATTATPMTTTDISTATLPTVSQTNQQQQVISNNCSLFSNANPKTLQLNSGSVEQAHQNQQQQTATKLNANAKAKACNGFEPTRRGLTEKRKEQDVEGGEDGQVEFEEKQQQQQRKKEEELDELERLRRVKREDDDDDYDEEDDEDEDAVVVEEDERELSGQVTVLDCERLVSAAAPLNNSSSNYSSSSSSNNSSNNNNSNKTAQNQQQQEERKRKLVAANKTHDDNNTVSAVNLCNAKQHLWPRQQQQPQHQQQLVQLQQHQIQMQQHQLILRMNNPVKMRTIFSCMWPGCSKNYDALEDIERHVRSHLGPKQCDAFGDEDFYYEETEVDEATYLAIFNRTNTLPLSPSHNSDGISSGQSFASSSPATSPVCSTDSSSSSSSSTSSASSSSHNSSTAHSAASSAASSSTSTYPSSQALYANSIDWNHFLANQNQQHNPLSLGKDGVVDMSSLNSVATTSSIAALAKQQHSNCFGHLNNTIQAHGLGLRLPNMAAAASASVSPLYNFTGKAPRKNKKQQQYQFYHHQQNSHLYPQTNHHLLQGSKKLYSPASLTESAAAVAVASLKNITSSPESVLNINSVNLSSLNPSKQQQLQLQSKNAAGAAAGTLQFSMQLTSGSSPVPSSSGTNNFQHGAMATNSSSLTSPITDSGMDEDNDDYLNDEDDYDDDEADDDVEDEEEEEEEDEEEDDDDDFDEMNAYEDQDDNDDKYDDYYYERRAATTEFAQKEERKKSKQAVVGSADGHDDDYVSGADDCNIAATSFSASADITTSGAIYRRSKQNNRVKTKQQVNQRRQLKNTNNTNHNTNHTNTKHYLAKHLNDHTYNSKPIGDRDTHFAYNNNNSKNNNSRKITKQRQIAAGCCDMSTTTIASPMTTTTSKSNVQQQQQNGTLMGIGLNSGMLSATTSGQTTPNKSASASSSSSSSNTTKFKAGSATTCLNKQQQANNHPKQNLSQRFFHNQSTSSQQYQQEKHNQYNNNNNNNNNHSNGINSSNNSSSSGNNNLKFGASTMAAAAAALSAAEEICQQTGSRSSTLSTSPLSLNNTKSLKQQLSTAPSSVSAGKKGRGENRKCRKVYGMDHRDDWCTQCKWKKACSRFCDQ